MKTQIIVALKFLFIMTILTGLVYPLIMTGVAQITFPSKANGSLIRKDDKIMGSSLISQKFDSTIYFWSRPSAIDYNPIPSGASNYGPTSEKLKKQKEAWSHTFAVKNLLTDTSSLPKEMISASGSGLDPDISPEAAILQVNRVALYRKYNDSQKQKLVSLIKNLTEEPQFLIFGERRINVFKLNLALDKIE
jgi:K+-transporting ATPase ATPase C chain